VRLDQYLVQHGWFPSRERARRAVRLGTVRLDGEVAPKPAASVPPNVVVEISPTGQRLASQPSRGGGKLAAALGHFAVDVADRAWLDVGASHGGFTEVLLHHGARRVYALDVGAGQLVPGLQRDPRVTVMDRVNVRHLAPDALPEPCGGIAIDVSFVSLLQVVPPLIPHLAPGGWLLALIKPQFEVGPRGVGKSGIVRDEALRQRTIEERGRQLAEFAPGLRLVGLFDSPVVGMGGNREAFACLKGEG